MSHVIKSWICIILIKRNNNIYWICLMMSSDNDSICLTMILFVNDYICLTMPISLFVILYEICPSVPCGMIYRFILSISISAHCQPYRGFHSNNNNNHGTPILPWHKLVSCSYYMYIVCWLILSLYYMMVKS